jgi:regulatory protein
MSRKISAIKLQKRNKERVNIYLDGEYAFGLARIVAAWLQVGQMLSDEKIEELKSRDAREAVYSQAIKLLNYRDRSEAEMRRSLKQDDVSDEIVDEVIDRLRRAGLINDERFAQNWIENRNEFRPRSRRALTYELKARGIDKDAFEQALEQVDDDELAFQAALKQSKKYQDLQWLEFRQKMYAFLARRGFSYETSGPAVRRVWEEMHADIENLNQ